MPTPVSLQGDGLLTNIAIAYANPELVGDLVIPPIPVRTKTGKFKKYNKEDRFTLPDAKVGPKGEPSEINWGVTEGTYTCQDYAYQELLDNESIMNAEAPIDARRATLNVLMAKMGLYREQLIAAEVYKAANYATTLDVAGAWATLSTDALSQLEAGMDACLVPPNVLVMGLPSWRKLARNEKVLAAIKGTLAPQSLKGGTGAAPAVKQSELAEYLGLDAVIVGRAKINTAKEGQSASFSYVWDGTNAGKGGAALIRTKTGSVLEDVVWAANFDWKTEVFSGPHSRGAFGGETIKVSRSFSIQSIATDVGYLFTDCLLT